MPRISKIVTRSTPDPSSLPDWASHGCALVADLERRGMLEQLGERVHIRREGGFSGVDVLLLLLHFFASKLPEGVRPFWRRASPFAQQLAVLAHRRALPSPASVSRALENVEPALFRGQIAWLLGEGCGSDEVSRSSQPDGGEPRADQMAIPGYQGRKRGEIVFRRATLQHAGSGVYLNATLARGNGDRDAELTAAANVGPRPARGPTPARLGHLAARPERGERSPPLRHRPRHRHGAPEPEDPACRRDAV